MRLAFIVCTMVLANRVAAELPEGVVAGVYKQLYSNGHVDETEVTCTGKMIWRAELMKSGSFYKAGDSSGDRRNSDSNYKAADGWYFRVFQDGNAFAWEFVKFTPRGTMEVHHFNSAPVYNERKSPEGSYNYCCRSVSNVEMQPVCNTTGIAAGTYKQAYTNGHNDFTLFSCDGVMSWVGEGQSETLGDTQGALTPAGSKLPEARATQNDDPDYQAEDGWWFRPWNRDSAFEFVKFTLDGAMVVHHFAVNREGTAVYCCKSTSYVEHRDECCHAENPVAAKGACVEDELAALKTRMDAIATLAGEEAQAKLTATITSQVTASLSDVIASSAGLSHEEVEALIAKTVATRTDDEITKLVNGEISEKQLVSKAALDDLSSKLDELQTTVARAASAQAAVAQAQQAAASTLSSNGALANPSSTPCSGGGCIPALSADGSDMLLSAPGGAVMLSSKQCGVLDLCDVVTKLDEATAALKKLGE